ncbi:MAG: ABC transporter permease [Acidobacteriia bacterium]|nr:ABC transporter permease [Terriglobia bacterium]
MRFLRRLLVRLANFATRRQNDQRLREEIEGHLALQTVENLRAGMLPAEARRQAVLKFGAVEAIREEYHAELGLPLIENLLQDLWYAMRVFAKSRGFAAVAILTIALGIGATTAIFSIVNAVLLRSLPYPEPDRLVKIFFNNPGTGLHGVRFSVPEMDDLRDRAGVFDYVSAACRGSIDLTGGAQPKRLEVLAVSSTYFSLLGATPQMGRLFSRQDFTAGYAPVVVISDSLWRRNFAADPNVLGHAIHLDNDPYTIVGVLPPGFRHPGLPRAQDVEVWQTSGFSAAPDPTPTRRTRLLPQAYGRLKQGVTLAQAQDRLTAMARELRHEYATDYPPEGKWTVEIQPLQEALVGNIRAVLLVLQGAVILIVLIVSLNIANLLLARASGRQQEMAMRSALGASRGRIVRQMLTESLLLSFVGGAAGIALAVAALKFMLRLIPPSIPRFSEVTVDWAVLAFALLISLLTGLLFGLAPAMHSTRTDLSMAIREGARGSGYSLKTGRLRDALIVSELAIAVVLMVGAGLLLRTLRDLLKEDPGFNPTQVVAASVNLPYPTDPKTDPYLTIAQQSTFYRELQCRMNAIPGVELAGFVSDLPAAGSPFNFALGIEDRPFKPGEILRAEPIIISPGYFEVMQAPLVRGRYFTEDDQDGKRPVAIVDESTARRYWPDRDPLGRRLRVGQDPTSSWRTIVGIVKDIKHDGLDVDGVPHIYVSIYQEFDAVQGVVFRDFSVVLRTSLPASVLDPQVRRQVQSIDPGLPVYNVTSMNELLDRSLASRRFSARLVGGFAVLALLLASIGIYGLLAYMVGQRSREIGLRMALGAGRADILKLILKKGIVLAGVGVIAGVILSASTASMMASLLYGVRPHDPAVFLIVPLLFLGVAALASYLPARRATKVDPMLALREG